MALFLLSRAWACVGAWACVRARGRGRGRGRGVRYAYGISKSLISLRKLGACNR